MARNHLNDLNDHLFEEMERLNDDTLSESQLDLEIRRGRALSALASQIIANGNLVLNAQRFQDERLGEGELPKMLEEASHDDESMD